MKNTLLVFALSALPLVGFSTVFPEDGWDISATDETGWNGPIPTSRAEGGSASFNYAYGTLRATKDLTIWRMHLDTGASGTVFDLAQDGNHKVTITDTEGTYNLQLNGNNTAYTFKGGIYDFISKAAIRLAYGRSGNALTLNGTIWTNVSSLALGYSNKSNNRLVVTNSAKIYVKNVYLSDQGGDKNYLELSDGSQLNLSVFRSDTYGNVSDKGNVMVVRGVGTKFNATSYLYQGVCVSGTELTFEDGAAGSCNEHRWGGIEDGGGYSLTSNNILRVLNGATFFAGSVGMDRTHHNLIVVTNSTFSSDWRCRIGSGSDMGGDNNRMEIVGSTGVGSLKYLHIGSTAISSNNTFFVSAGAKFSTSDNTYVGEASENNQMIITGQNTAGSPARLLIGEKATANGNVVTVDDGAQLTVSSKTHVGLYGSSNRLELADSGTVGTFQNILIGTNAFSTANLTRLCDGATATVSEAVYAGVGGFDNRLEITGENTDLTTRDFFVGDEATSSNNVAVVDNGANLKTTRAAYIGNYGANNALLVSNATYTLSSGTAFTIGRYAGATNALLRIAGASAGISGLVKKTSWSDEKGGPFGAAGYGVFELADHISLSTQIPDLVVGHASDGNVFRLRDYATIYSESGGIIYRAGYPASGDKPATKNNRIEILDNANMLIYRAMAQGDNCGIVVSNATLTIRNGYQNGIIIGGTGATGNYLRLEGETPRVFCSVYSINGIYLSEASRIEFVLPQTPYSTVPVHAQCVSMSSDCQLKIDLSALDAAPHRGLKYNLIRVQNADATTLLDASVLTATNAELAPKGASLAWEGADLYLTVKSTMGLTIFIK